MSSLEDISDYYNQTFTHYLTWWNLSKSNALHYGIWHSGTKNFEEALANTNKLMAQLANIERNSKVLDAGCGVGGSSFFLAKEFGCIVEAITLNEKQVNFGKEYIQKNKLEPQVCISQQDYCNTNFKDESFDFVWACESSCHAYPKELFYKEAYRVLKPNGKLVVADYFITEKGKANKNKYIDKWSELWAIKEFHQYNRVREESASQSLNLIFDGNYTKEIMPSAKKMYWAAILGAPFSEGYNLLFGASRFAKHHYRTGYYQYKALKADQWDYRILVFEKGAL